jgi:hypothetical protein
MEGKTTIKKFLKVFGDRIPTRVANNLELQHRIVDPSVVQKRGDIEYVWVDKFEYLEDIKKSEFLKGRNVGEGTWGQFVSVRKEYLEEAKSDKALETLKKNQDGVLLPSTVERLQDLTRMYDKDNLSLGTVGIYAMFFGSFAKQEPQIKHFLPVRDNDHTKILKKQSGTGKGAIEYQIAVDDVLFHGYKELTDSNARYSLLVNEDYTRNLLFNRDNKKLYFAIGGEPIRTIDELAMGNPYSEIKYMVTGSTARQLKLIR